MSYPPGPNPYDPPPAPPPFQPAGYPPDRYGPPNPNQTPLILAIGSLVTGTMGVLTCLCCIFLPLPAISIVLGSVALMQKPDDTARILAIAGLALSGLILMAWGGMIAMGFANATLNNPGFFSPPGR